MELINFGTALPCEDAERLVFCCCCFERFCERCTQACLDRQKRAVGEAEVKPMTPDTADYSEICAICLVELPFGRRENEVIACIHPQHTRELGGFVDPGLVDSDVLVKEGGSGREGEGAPLVDRAEKPLVE